LQEFDVRLHEPDVLQLAQLPRVPEPGGDVGFNFRLEFRVIEPVLQILPSLFTKRLQAVQLVQRGAVDLLAFGGFQLILGTDLRAIEKAGQRVERVLCAGQVGVAELLGLLFHLPGGFGIKCSQAGADEVVHQRLEQVQAFLLRLNFFLQRAGIDLTRFVGFHLFLFNALNDFRALFGDVRRHFLFDEFLALCIGVEQRERMFAGKLMTWARAAIDGFGAVGKIGGRPVIFGAATLAIAEEQGAIGRFEKTDELLFDDDHARVLDSCRVGRLRIHKCLVDLHRLRHQ
jgi:hypothetical protein